MTSSRPVRVSTPGAMNGVITFRTRINPGAMNGAPTGKNAATGAHFCAPGQTPHRLDVIASRTRINPGAMNGVITSRARINPGRHEWRPYGNAATGGALMRPWSNTAPFGRHRVPYAHQSGRHEWRHHVPYAHQSGRHEWRPYGEKCRRRGRINALLVKHRAVWTRDTG